MRALVSGSTGFSGTFLVAVLRARGIEVSAVSQRADTAGVQRIDLTSSAAWAGVLRDVRPDHVFHLSGVMHAPDTSSFVAQNTAAAAALLDAVASEQLAPASLLFVGTAAEYGLVPESALPVSETFPALPRSPYGISKYAQTQLALDAARRGLRVIVARPSNLIGPGMPLGTALGSFARQIRDIEQGRRAPVLHVGDLSTSRDFIDVRDAVEVYATLATERDFRGVVNVSSGEHVTMHWILDELIAHFGVPVSVEVDAARLRAAEVQKFSASPERLREAIGARSWISLADSLRDMVAHERQTV